MIDFCPIASSTLQPVQVLYAWHFHLLLRCRIALIAGDDRMVQKFFSELDELEVDINYLRLHGGRGERSEYQPPAVGGPDGLL